MEEQLENKINCISGNFWTPEAFRLVEAYFMERSQSMQSIIKFICHFSKQEDEYALSIEKLIKRTSETIKEGDSVQAVWSVFVRQMEIKIKYLYERSAKLRSDISVQLEQFQTEHNRRVKRDLSEIRKLFDEYAGMQSELIKAREKYTKTSEIAAQSGKLFQDNETADSKLLLKLEKEKSKNESPARFSEDTYKEIVNKIRHFHPIFINRVITLYDQLQSQDLVRTNSIAHCFQKFALVHHSSQNLILDIRKSLEEVLSGVNTQQDLKDWIENSSPNSPPPPDPVFLAWTPELHRLSEVKPKKLSKSSINDDFNINLTKLRRKSANLTSKIMILTDRVSHKDSQEDLLKRDVPSLSPSSPVWVCALYDYVATTPVEISFNEGDTFQVLVKNESGWWTGQFNGASGLFPVNFVDEIPAPNTNTENTLM
jgi:hypothetical protein